MGLETLQGRRDECKLKLWYKLKLASMSEDRYPRRVFSQDWDAKPRIYVEVGREKYGVGWIIGFR